jgi:NADH-quinone oxidoreductase subunit J
MSLESLVLYFFAASALAGGVLMLVARHPMRVALALIGSMVSLAGIYAILGVHVIAVFQVLIYVGAVMVFMVYVIMLLDPRDPGYSRRYSGLVLPGLAAAVLFIGALGYAIWHALPEITRVAGEASYGLKEFSVAFLNEYWLHFELTSVLLVAAIVAAVAVVKLNRRDRG